MLDFKREKVSNQLAAHSEKNPFKSYWIEEGAWAHLSTVRIGDNGPYVGRALPFDTVAEAKQAAQAMEVADNAENQSK